MPEPDDPRRVTYGAPVEGLELVLQAAPAGARSFAATYVGPGGWAFDPPGREGLAGLTNQLVVSAAGHRRRLELARALDRAGATLTHDASPESAEVTLSGPAGDLPRLLGVLADVVRRPRFDPDDVARGIRQHRERQLRETNQPAPRAHRELMAAIYPVGHPYRSTGLGTPASLGRIARADLVRFHRQQYTAEDAVLVVTAPTSVRGIERVARRAFAGGTGPAPRPLTVPAVRRPAARVRRVGLPGNSQVEIRLGGPSVRRSDPAFPAAYLANELLGGRPLLGRLFQRVRERRGLAYHASSGLDAMRFGGYWTAQAGTGADRWRETLRLVREEVVRIGRTVVPARELRAIRESAIGELPLSLESTHDAHELAVDVAYHRLAPDHWVRWPSLLRTVTPDEVRAAAARALDVRGAATVLVGPLGRA